MKIYKTVPEPVKKDILQKSKEIKSQLPEIYQNLGLFIMNYYNDPDSLYNKENKIEIKGYTLLFRHMTETVGVGYTLWGEKEYKPFISLAIIDKN